MFIISTYIFYVVKFVGLTLEYVHLLTSQLEQHRRMWDFCYYSKSQKTSIFLKLLNSSHRYIENHAIREKEGHEIIQKSESLLNECTALRDQKQANLDRYESIEKYSTTCRFYI